MDKTEQFAEAIYKTIMENLYRDILSNLDSDTEPKRKYLKFIKDLYKGFSQEEKKMFNYFIKSILDDCSSTILADLDAISDISNYPCDNIKILCNDKQINPWLHELFMAIVQEKNPEI